MEIEIVKQVIRNYEPWHSEFVRKASEGKRYFKNDSDIMHQPIGKDDDGNVLRNADNRIPRNFHGLLVNQKAAYAFTTPPTFDVGNDTANKKIIDVLGDDYRRYCTQLCKYAANTSIGWVHFWSGNSGEFEWSPVDSEQVIPVWNQSLKKRLLAVLRCYSELEEETGNLYMIYEYWNDLECQTYRRLASDTLDALEEYHIFDDPESGELTGSYTHNLGVVPFIAFHNNDIGTNDLVNIKPLIDVYDKVYSGFINDLDDVQELIFVLTNYGGENLQDFLTDLKKYKVIKVDGDESGSGVNTLSIEIPIEARNSVLETTRKAIFEQGFGFDPRPETFGNQSGEALKFMYSLLEMKVGLMETEFQSAFNVLVRAICEFYHLSAGHIIQTWTRTRIKNDTEQASICKNSVGVVSKKTILKNHPLVEDADVELKQLEAEEEEAKAKMDEYQESFAPQAEAKTQEE